MTRYVVKNADNKYADGGRGWVHRRRDAYVFVDRLPDCNAKDWADGHARSLSDKTARAVRLVGHRPRVTLRFRSQSDRRYFFGQLSDGWGENFVSLEWPEGVSLVDADVVDVVPVREDDE